MFKDNFKFFLSYRVWTFKDICLAASPPEFEIHYIDTVSFKNMFTVYIIL